MLFVTCGRENDKMFVVAQCRVSMSHFYILITPAQLDEPKTLIVVVAAASVFLSVTLLHFLRLASQLGAFQPSGTEQLNYRHRPSTVPTATRINGSSFIW